MAKQWNQRDAKRFARDVVLGKPYFYITEHTTYTPGDDHFTYTEVVFTGRLPLTNSPCTSSGYSAVTLCQNFGPMYDAPPPKIRNIRDPKPQVAGPDVEGPGRRWWRS